MLHLGPGPSQQAGSLPPRMLPWGIPSAALPAQSQVPCDLCSSRASRKLGSLSHASSGHLTPHGQPGGGARPLGSAPLHRRPARRPPPCLGSSAPRPAASCLPFVSTHSRTMPPAPQDSRGGAARMALRERRSCRPHRRFARPPSGATA